MTGHGADMFCIFVGRITLRTADQTNDGDVMSGVIVTFLISAKEVMF